MDHAMSPWLFVSPTVPSSEEHTALRKVAACLAAGPNLRLQEIPEKCYTLFLQSQCASV